jgi:hypothetical protein
MQKFVKGLLARTAILLLLLAVLAADRPSRAQLNVVGGTPLTPLGSCQITATGTAQNLAACTRASFTGTGTGTSLVVTSVTGIILIGDTVAGTGVPTGTTIVSQVSGTSGGAGTYKTSLPTTSSSASLTSGGIPAIATFMVLVVETANIRWRDDGGAPTTSIGFLLTPTTPPMVYSAQILAFQFIAVSGSPVVDVAFYRPIGQ